MMLERPVGVPLGREAGAAALAALAVTVTTDVYDES